MNSNGHNKFELNDDVLGFDLLKELEEQTSEKIRQQRSSERITVKSKVILQPGNSSELMKFKLQGITGDISSGGTRILFPLPIHVGDIYRLLFDPVTLELPMVFARCLRCRLIREDAYEAGFSFFTPVKLPYAATEEPDITSLI